jgi:hypothetical protein
MSTCQTKRQANFKDFKRFGAFKGFGEQKNVVFNSFVCKLGFFWHESNSRFKLAQSCQKKAFFGMSQTRVLNWPSHAKKSPIYTRIR